MTRYPSLLILCLFLTWAAVGPAVAQQAAGADQQVWLSGENSEGRLAVTVAGGRYALAWNNIEPRWAVIGSEKLYVLTLAVHNEGPQSRRIDPDTLKVTLTDGAGVSYGTPLAFRVSSRTMSAETQLMPNTTLHIDVGFLVPGEARINGAYILDPKHGVDPGKQFHFQSAASLPRRISNGGVTVAPIVEGSKNNWYPLGITDVRINDISLASGPIGNLTPNESTDVAVVSFEARNRSNADLRIHRGVYRDSTISTSDGDRTMMSLLFETTDNSTDFQLMPGQTVQLRATYKLDKGADIQRVDLVEKIGSRGGSFSRRYLIGNNSSGAGENATIGLDSGPGTVTPVGTGIAHDMMADLPAGLSQENSNATVEDIGSTPIPSTPDPRDLPPGVTGEVPITVLADPMLIEGISGTIEPEKLSFPDHQYVVRLQRFSIVAPQEPSGDEPWLAVLKLQGRQGDQKNPVSIFNSSRDRSFLGPVDWAKAGTSRNLSGSRLYARRFETARPYEIHAYVVLAFEGDNSDDDERSAVARTIMGRIQRDWLADMDESNDLDYADLSEQTRRRAVSRFEAFAERFERRARAFARRAALQFDWSGGDTDDFFSAEVISWIHVDAAGNPGAFINGGFMPKSGPVKVTGPYEFQFDGNSGGLVLGPERAMVHTLRFEVSPETP